ncbi:hypothetical protein [Halomonas sp. CSM-2]|uniref:hypothetical protein n=1 Tax=Halomonas sp. CSM-2 TaxID=1975722 RepID=UPI000A285C9D|nr:hypothetical protein [Halomonas sp. CSM-2]
MRILFIKYLNILVLLGFLAWFLWPDFDTWAFEWEPLLGLILVFVTYLGLEAKDHHQPQSDDKVLVETKPGEDDVRLLAMFRKLLEPADVTFFREHDFLGSFRNEPVKRLFEYLETWTTVEHEFIDSAVEEQHGKFRQKAMALGLVLSQYTTNHGEFSTVKPPGSQNEPTPEWVKKEAEEINQKASDFVEAHQEFLKFARNRFSGAGDL